MALLDDINEQIQDIEDDDRHISGLESPAQVWCNAPLALIQCSLSSRLDVLKWIRDIIQPEAGEPSNVGCVDCGKAYDDFPIDTTLPDDQWATIYPEVDGLLCAGCIVKRAANIPGMIAARMTLDVS
jgi:hypothetical protein